MELPLEIEEIWKKYEYRKYSSTWESESDKFKEATDDIERLMEYIKNK